MAYNYSNKVIVITGGAGGIGSHLAREFSMRGATLVLLDLDAQRLEATMSTLTGTGHHHKNDPTCDWLISPDCRYL